MELLSVDEKKCKKDKLCVNECPFGILEMNEINGYPRLVSGGETICNACGHCVVVCPHDALNHKYVPIEESPIIDDDLAISEAQAIQFLRSRRSIRRFKDQPVKKEKIQRLIETARYAPTARNAQLLEWAVITDKAKLRELAKLTIDWIRHDMEKNPGQPRAPYFPLMVAAWDAGNDMILRGAPALIIASAPKESAFGLVDLSLALSYLELMAPMLGLGTCWAGLLEGALLQWPPARELLGLSDDRPYHYPMMLGYPVSRYLRLPQRRRPKITWP
jgi:nitroreductase/NAD-dependent dihydropyrimidine dehydrogenase PreA subunit